MPRPAHDPFPLDELPGYLAEPPGPGTDPIRLRDLLAGVHHGAQRLADFTLPAVARASRPRVASPGTPAAVLPELSAGFLRLIKLPGARLSTTIEEWWATARQGDDALVGRRLRLDRPLGGTPAGWSMTGRVRRPPAHWIPIVVDLWPFSDGWTMLAMTPQSRVVCSRRYFRTGHAVLDCLTAALLETSAGQGG